MSAKQIKDKNALLEQEVWVLYKYSDGSEFCFKTTMCEGILNKLGIVLEAGKLPRLDKKYYERGQFVYRQFPFDQVTVTLWDEEHYTHELSKKLKSFL